MSSDSHRTVVRFSAVMALVAGVDLLSKAIASAVIDGAPVPLAGPLRLELIQNHGSAFGVSLGPYTWHLNAIATLLALGLAMSAVRALSAVDRLAPIALGLIAGAAIGNLTSLLAPPAGVTDFLSVNLGARGRLIMNFADIAGYSGLAMTLRSAMRLGVAIRATRGVRPAAVPEVEIPIPLAVEGRRNPSRPHERPLGVPLADVSPVDAPRM